MAGLALSTSAAAAWMSVASLWSAVIAVTVRPNR
jgi:hypothetical protein